MKYRYIFALCAASILAFSCYKEQSVPQETVLPESGNEAVTILTAGIEQTKTVLDGTSVLWKDGNKINVNGEESTALSLAVPSASAEFTLGVISLPYKALYPASAYTSASTLTLPYTQEYTAGSFADGAAAMYAYTTEGNNLSFHHLTCIVKVSVTRASSDPDTHDIKYVEFRSKGTEKVSGLFSIDYTTGELTPSGAAGDTDNTVRVTGSVSTASGADFYIAVPANTYASGFTVKVCDTEGHYMEKSKDASTALEAGHIHPMAAFEFVPTRTEVETIIITSAAGLTTFATNWNSGAYSDADPFTVQLGNNITFTSEEAAAFPGIGTSTGTAFTGTFDGNNKTITFANANYPLVGFLGSKGNVHDVNISGSFTFTGGASSIYAGALVGNASGGSTITSCTSDATVTVTGTTTAYSCFGGLIGRVYNCTADNCTFSGALLSPTSFEGGNITIDAGGITGCIAANGQVSNSTMSGYIQWLGEVGNSTNISGNLNLGGIAGTVEGKISSCHVLKNESATYSAHNATLLVGGDATYTHYILRLGGLAGRVNNAEAKISDSDNAANLFVTDRRGTANSSNTLYIGGLVAHLNNGEVSLCSNLSSGEVTTMSAVLTQYAGGAVGYCADNGKMNNVSNGASMLLDWANAGTLSNNIARAHHIGGVIGYNASENLASLSNTGDVTKNQVISNTNPASVQNIGGVIGYSTKDIIGNNAISNAGVVELISDNGWTNTTNGVCIGGIVGKTNGNVSGVSTTTDAKVLVTATTTAGTMLYAGGIVGLLTTAGKSISSCTNNGEVSFSLPDKINFTEAYFAGILGACSTDIATTISDCTNNGFVHGGYGKASSGGGTYYCAAGIAGRLYGASLVKECHNLGEIYNDHYYNVAVADIDKGSVAGGIVGNAQGASATERLTIIDCSDDSSSIVRGRRGSTGGIVGYAKWTDISSCNNYGSMTSSDTSASYFPGGICGVAIASSIDNCNATCGIKATQARANGGIVGWMDANSTVSNCSYNGTIQKSSYESAIHGAIAGKTEAGGSIDNCTISGTLAGTAITAVSQAIGDSNITPTNITVL